MADAADGRFLPGLEVTATLTRSGGQKVGSHKQPLLWHSWLYHYGRNWVLPESGTYDLTIEVQPPAYMRHDKANGMRHTRKAYAEFKNIELETGQKIS